MLAHAFLPAHATPPPSVERMHPQSFQHMPPPHNPSSTYIHKPTSTCTHNPSSTCHPPTIPLAHAPRCKNGWSCACHVATLDPRNMFLLLLPHSPVAKPSDLTLFCRKKWSLRSVCNLQQFMQTPILLWHLPVAKSPSNCL